MASKLAVSSQQVFLKVDVDCEYVTGYVIDVTGAGTTP